MSANWVDLTLLVGLLVVAIAGWRSGVITTAASFAGFIGGALCGAWLVPHLIADRQWPTFLQAVATLVGMFVLGVIGQSILGFAGRTVRDAVDFRPVRVVDSASGMVVSVLAFLMCAWMVLSVAASSSLGPTSEQVRARASRAFPLLDQVLAGPGGALLDDARELLATIDVPSLPFNPATLPPVEDPANVDISKVAARVARESVVQVSTTSTRCGSSSLGSGVVVSPWARGSWSAPDGWPRTPMWWPVRVASPSGRRPTARRAGRAWSSSTRRTTSRSCTCPAWRPRLRGGSRRLRAGRTQSWPGTRAGGR